MKTLKNKLLCIVLFLTYTLDMTFICVWGKKILDSDISSEMVLAKLLNDEHSIIGMSKNWFYSSELRFMHMHWLFRIGLLLFPHNWHFARAFSMFIAIALLAFLTYRLFVALGQKEMALMAAIVAIMPAGSWYFWQTLFGGQYLPYMVISLLSLICIARLSKEESNVKTVILYGILAAFLGFAAGMNGVKQLMVFYAPLVITALLMCFFSARKRKQIDFASKEMRILYISIWESLFALTGYIVNSRFMSKIYTFDQYNDTKIQGGSILKLIRDYVWSFGYAEGEKLVSVGGVMSLAGLAIGAMTIFCGARLLKKYNEMDGYLQFITLFSVVCIIFCIVIFAYVGGEIQYFQPCVPFGLFLIVLDLYTEKFVFKHSKTCFISAFVIALFITSLGTLKNEFSEPLHIKQARKNLDVVAEEIRSMGYTKGVGYFWDANVITEMTDGEIEMWSLIYFDSDEMYQWLQNKSHYGTFPNGQYFFIIRDYQDNSGFLERHPGLELIYSDNGYYVYGN